MLLRFIIWIKCFLSIPYFFIFRLFNYRIQKADLNSYLNNLTIMKYKYEFFNFIKTFACLPEYRSQVLWRANLEWLLCPKATTHFVVSSKKIGKGLVLQHGFSTIIFPERIGENCQIWHNVTIGRNGKDRKNPIIGDNVKIYAGAVVIGGIKIGNNAIIGANAVVLQDVPDNSIAVGVPAKIRLKK